MKLLIDMNLSPEWVRVLGEKGFDAIHWSKIGMPIASDHEIMSWAKANGYILFTHDLDFGAILAATRATGPSVIQIRVQNVNPYHLGNFVHEMLKQFEDYLAKGALISVDEAKSRVHILPLIE
jgi:predicted nuclease of predicted toxin-antitoxin system